MGGGVLQLAAYGGQDIETMGNPQMTFFKSVYKKHTNFSIEIIEQSFNGNITKEESRVDSTISKSGDLIHGCHLDIKFPEFPVGSGSSYNNWVNSTGYAYVKEVSLSIGELQIDKHYSEWFDIWNELTDIQIKEHLLVNKHILKEWHLRENTGNCKPIQCYVPLIFWFNRYYNCALPILALQYHDVKLNFTFRNLDFLINTDGTLGNNTEAPSVKLYTEYIFLDVEERKMFANNKHEYLIEQVQHKNINFSKINEIKFNFQIKELIWVVRNNNAGLEKTSNIDSISNKSNTDSTTSHTFINGNDYFNYETNTYDTNRIEYVGGYASNEPFEKCKIVMNGIDRFSEQKASYFRTMQPLRYHSRTPTKHIYMYSFSLNPEKYQPSGTCNFSRLHTVNLNFDNITTDDSQLLVFATNYNVLVISSGMAGLKYAN